jgi:hypothetical protein
MAQLDRLRWRRLRTPGRSLGRSFTRLHISIAP